jgi:hypothetical protein
VNTNTCKAFTTVGVASLAALSALAACGGGGETKLTPKADFELAVKDLTNPVAIMAVYERYLTPPPDPKFNPRHRSDQEKAAMHAANEIRFACTGVRQRSKSAAVAALAGPLGEVSKACAKPDNMDEVKACTGKLAELKKALEAKAAEAKAAGVSGFPLLAQEAINDHAKADIAPFNRAMTPGKEETAYLGKLQDDKLTTDDVVNACRNAAGEVDANVHTLKDAGDTIHSLSRIHKMSMDAHCTVLTRADGLYKGLKLCLELEKVTEEAETECRRVCAQAKTQLSTGLPAAAFKDMQERWDETCSKEAMEERKKAVK